MTEESLQIMVADWLRLQYPDLLWWHTPNGGIRNKSTGARLKRMGTRAGVPDIFIPLPQSAFDKVKILRPDFIDEGAPLLIDSIQMHKILNQKKGFFCELKMGKNKTTESQKEVMKQLEYLGYYCCEVRTFEEFEREFKNYMRWN